MAVYRYARVSTTGQDLTVLSPPRSSNKTCGFAISGIAPRKANSTYAAPRPLLLLAKSRLGRDRPNPNQAYMIYTP